MRGITFKDYDAPPYTSVTYRVRAKVNGKYSKWSNSAALDDAPTLILSKAA